MRERWNGFRDNPGDETGGIDKFGPRMQQRAVNRVRDGVIPIHNDTVAGKMTLDDFTTHRPLGAQEEVIVRRMGINLNREIKALNRDLRTSGYNPNATEAEIAAMSPADRARHEELTRRVESLQNRRAGLLGEAEPGSGHNISELLHESSSRRAKKLQRRLAGERIVARRQGAAPDELRTDEETGRVLGLDAAAWLRNNRQGQMDKGKGLQYWNEAGTLQGTRPETEEEADRAEAFAKDPNVATLIRDVRKRLAATEASAARRGQTLEGDALAAHRQRTIKRLIAGKFYEDYDGYSKVNDPENYAEVERLLGLSADDFDKAVAKNGALENIRRRQVITPHGRAPYIDPYEARREEAEAKRQRRHRDEDDEDDTYDDSDYDNDPVDSDDALTDEERAELEARVEALRRDPSLLTRPEFALQVKHFVAEVLEDELDTQIEYWNNRGLHNEALIREDLILATLDQVMRVEYGLNVEEVAAAVPGEFSDFDLMMDMSYFELEEAIERQNGPVNEPEPTPEPTPDPLAEAARERAEREAAEHRRQQLLLALALLAMRSGDGFRVVTPQGTPKSAVERRVDQEIEAQRQAGVKDSKILRNLGKQYHPDAVGDDPRAAEAFKYASQQLDKTNGAKEKE